MELFSIRIRRTFQLVSTFFHDIYYLFRFVCCKDKNNKSKPNRVLSQKKYTYLYKYMLYNFQFTGIEHHTPILNIEKNVCQN